MMVFESFILAILYLPLHLVLEIFYYVFGHRPQKTITNEHILITGAAQGIGAEFARQFAELGNTVHCVDVNKVMIEEKVDELKSNGHEALAYTCDITDVAQVKDLYEAISFSGKPITVLVNNAGVAFGMALTDMSFTQIQHTVNVNMVSNLWFIKLFLPGMIALDKGHIVNVSSLGGYFPMYNHTDYCATKAASIHMLEQLKLQTAGSNVKFTAICPRFVQTKMISGVNCKEVKAQQPEDVVAAAIKGVLENKEIVVTPSSRNLLFPIRMIMPNYIKDMVYVKAKRASELLIKDFVGQRMAEKIK